MPITPRRPIGMSGSDAANCRSLIQNSLAIDPLPSVKELESDPPDPGQENNWVPSLEQRLGGRTTADELLKRRHGMKQSGAAQIRKFHAKQANPDLAAVKNRMAALEAMNEDLIRRVAMLEPRVPIVPADRKPPCLGHAKNGVRML